MDFLLDGQASKRLLFRKIQPSDFNDWLPFHQEPRNSQYGEGLPQDLKVACEQDFDSTFFRYKNNLGGKMAIGIGLELDVSTIYNGNPVYIYRKS